MKRTENQRVTIELLGGNKLRRRHALELDKVAEGGLAVAETGLVIERLVVALRVSLKLVGHEFDALAVEIVVEGQTRVFLDAAGYVDAVGA